MSSQSNTIPSDFIHQFFGAVHLNKEHHAYADQVGASWGRVGITWDTHEPRRDQYSFSSYDSLVNSAQSYNLNILPVINHSALWASSAPDSITSYRQMYAPSGKYQNEWVEYVEKVVTRYPDIKYFEVWNEPNIDWFLRANVNYKTYVDSILIPAAKVIHKHGRKVVGPSFTTEWPLDSWPPKKRPRKHAENVASNIKAINQWLSYNDAWKYIDILSIHYTHGDTEKSSNLYADNMMTFYDYVYNKWIEHGKIDGIWNTEEGFAGVEAGMQGFVALDSWETEPISQWAPRYTIPIIHWAINHGWNRKNQYKVFWYHMSEGSHPRDLLRTVNGELKPTPSGQALKTARDLLTSGDQITTYPHPVRTGFGIHSDDTEAINYFAPYEFTNYSFKLDQKVVTAIWTTLPRTSAFGQPIQVTVRGLSPDQNYTLTQTQYVTGDKTEIGKATTDNKGKLRFTIPPTDDNIVYVTIQS